MVIPIPERIAPQGPPTTTGGRPSLVGEWGGGSCFAFSNTVKSGCYISTDREKSVVKSELPL